MELKQPRLKFGIGNNMNTQTNNKEGTSEGKQKPKQKQSQQQTPKTKTKTKIKQITETKETKKHPPIKGYITTNKTTLPKTTTTEPLPKPRITTPKPTKTTPKTTKPEVNNKENKKIRTKPPDIDKTTPVSLPIKVRGTVVTDLKGFLARKKLERELKQEKMHRTAQNSNTEAEGVLQTKPPE